MGKKREKKNSGLPDNLYTNTKAGVVYYRYKHPQTGKFHPMGKDQAQAVDGANQLNQVLCKGAALVAQILTPGVNTVADVIDEYIKDVVPHKAWDTSTRRKYLNAVKRFKREFGGSIFKHTDRMFLGKWLVENTPSNEAYNKNREHMNDVWDFAISRKYIDINEPGATLKRSLSKKIKSNQKVRQRLTVDQFWAIHEIAPEWLHIAMEISLVTLQARKEIVNMKFKDVRDGNLFVIRAKTCAVSDMAFIKIPITKQLDELFARARQSRIVSPLVIHYSPQRRRKDQQESKVHWSAVTDDYLTKQFKKYRDKVEDFDGVEMVERPTFHEIRSLGGRIYEELGYSKEYIQALMTHTDVKTTQIYLEGGELTDKNYNQVQADLNLKQLPNI